MAMISVIIPAYNVERWIAYTVKSVQEQTFSDLEIIVIDDGSTDSTLAILQGITDERLKFFSYEHSGLSSVSRNRGIAHSTCAFIAFLDADDLWTPDSLELKLIALYEHPEADVAYCWTSIIDENGTIIKSRHPVFYEGNIYFKCLTGFAFECGSFLVRRRAVESIGGYDPTLHYGEDIDFGLRLARHSSVVLVPRYQLFYRQRNGSKTSSIDTIEKLELFEKDRIKIRERAFQKAPKGFECHRRQWMAKFLRYCAGLHMQCQPDREGAKRADQRLQKAIRTIQNSCSSSPR